MEKIADIPEGYNYDFVNADALLNLLSVNNNQIVFKRHAIKFLGNNSTQMTVKCLKIRSLVDAGAIVVGPKPIAHRFNRDKTEFNSS